MNKTNNTPTKNFLSRQNGIRIGSEKKKLLMQFLQTQQKYIHFKKKI